jgi:hypothetical protein
LFITPFQNKGRNKGEKVQDFFYQKGSNACYQQDIERLMGGIN